MALPLVRKRLETLEAQAIDGTVMHVRPFPDFRVEFPTQLTPKGEILTYTPSPTGKLFHAHDGRVRAVMGPVGSGKSTMMCMDILFQSLKVPPMEDGIIRVCWAIVRSTYAELKMTTVKSWKLWFDAIGHLTKAPPMEYTALLNIDDDKKTKLQLDIIFVSLERDDDIKKLDSLEITGGYMNEARHLKDSFLTTLRERVGRYPPIQRVQGEFVGKVILDTNPPSTRHWWYKKFEGVPPEYHAIFKQPSGLIKTKEGYEANPEAENLVNLEKDYYINLVPGKSDEDIKVQLMGKYGILSTGDPVYPMYNDDIHSSTHAEYDHTNPVVGIGWDYGLTPAVVFCQLNILGQLVVFKEITSFNMTVEDFFMDKVMPFIRATFPKKDLRSFTSVGDPTGNTRDDTHGATAHRYLASQGLPTEAATTNEPVTRQGAVRYFLNRMTMGKPSFVLSRSQCPTLREGFMGGYCLKLTGGKLAPDKINDFSHVHDALQYMALHFHAPVRSKKPYVAKIIKNFSGLV